MKKLIALFLMATPFGIFAQTNMHDAKIMGSISVGNKEVTSVLDETTGCSHKSNLHTKGLFTVGESVKLDMETNPNQPKIVKPNLPEVVFVDRCKKDELDSESKMFIPNGSKINRTDINLITITPPNGWAYVFQTRDNGQLETTMRIGSAGVTCDCEEQEDGADGEGGCHPQVSNQGAFACVITSPCKTCKKTVSSISATNRLTVENTGSGFINLNAGIDFEKGKNPMPIGFNLMFDIPEVKAAMDKFVEEIYDKNAIPEPIFNNETGELDAPSGYSFAVINAYGRVFSLIVPNDKIPNGRIASSSITCECTEGDGDCVPTANGPWRACKSSCKACKLTVKKTHDPYDNFRF